jgi:hypothetical protein
MPIYKGTTLIQNVYKGSVAVPNVYVGSSNVHAPSGPVVRAYIKDTSFASHNSSATGETIARPANYAAGDLIVLAIVQDMGGAANITTPSGFTSLGTLATGVTGASGGAVHGIFYKVATGSEPASYSFTVNSSSDGLARCFVISGWTGNTANLRYAQAATASSNTAHSAPAVTPLTNKNLILRGVAHDDNEGSASWTWTAPTGHVLAGKAGETGLNTLKNAGGYVGAAFAMRDYDSTTALAAGSFAMTGSGTVARAGVGWSLAIPSN